jgi:hypothetical protein
MQLEKKAELNAQEEELLARFGAVMEMSGVHTPPMDGGEGSEGGEGGEGGESTELLQGGQAPPLVGLEIALEKEQQRQEERVQPPPPPMPGK